MRLVSNQWQSARTVEAIGGVLLPLRVAASIVVVALLSVLGQCGDGVGGVSSREEGVRGLFGLAGLA